MPQKQKIFELCNKLKRVYILGELGYLFYITKLKSKHGRLIVSLIILNSTTFTIFVLLPFHVGVHNLNNDITRGIINQKIQTASSISSPFTQCYPCIINAHYVNTVSVKFLSISMVNDSC